ncbi:hypothetical protein BDY24DRAFT_399529 [Mrakia frigida]|uniref:uncharacterized protein n=1 Tax=Mrakia frigida TaxID=29902 RepID=UPI003FCC21D5
MSSFSTFLPRVALRTTTTYVSSSLPRLYRLTSRSSAPSSSSSPSSNPTTTNESIDIKSPPPPKDRRETGLDPPLSIPAWPSSNSSSSAAPSPSTSSSSSSSIPNPSLLPPLLPDDIPSDPQARREFFKARNHLQKAATRTAFLSSLSPSDLELHLAKEARAKRLHAMTPSERETERERERRQEYEDRLARREAMEPLEAFEDEQRRQAQLAFQALSAEEKKKWKIAERERVMTEGKTDREKNRYLALSRQNRNVSKFGVKEMERRTKERAVRATWGPLKVREKTPREDKRKGIHGPEARTARAAFLPARRGGGGGGTGEGGRSGAGSPRT